MAKLSRYCVAGVIGLLMCCLFNTAVAQNNFNIIYKPVDKDSSFLLRELKLETSFPAYMQASQYVDKLDKLLGSKGYISASIDTIITFEKELHIHLFIGEKYHELTLEIEAKDQPVLQSAGVNLLLNKNKPLSFDQYQSATEKLLDHFEKTGYPFAQVKLDSVVINDQKITARLFIEKGFPYKIDSIRLYGPARISRNFLHRYLDIPRGSLYNKEKLNKINQRLLELPYLEQMQPWNMTMLNTGSLIDLYLKTKRSNQVYVLAGFLPSNEQLGGKLLLTVDANLQLKNAFGGGEAIGVVWQQIQPRSPKIDISFAQPFAFNSPVGFDLGFQLFKRDSSFLNINGQLGFMYMISATQSAKVILQTSKTNVLQVDTFSIKASKKLPDVADVSSLGFGLDYELITTDYRFNPRKGNELKFSIVTASKTINKNTTITQLKDPSFDYNSLYDTLKLKSQQLRVKVDAAHYFKTGKQAVIKTAFRGGIFESANYFRNELFQVGGYKLLRGFDEESIFANRYLVGTVEYRYLIGLNSYFFGFTDVGWSQNKIVDLNNTYVGAGIGISLETKGGIFNISYAAGKRNDLDFSLRQSKIHIGFVSIF